MKVRLTNPALAVDLAAFLARAVCNVRVGRDGTLEVDVPDTLTSRQASTYLNLYVQAWAALNPNVGYAVEDDMPALRSAPPRYAVAARPRTG